MRVILRPLRRDSWSGLKEGQKYRNCYEDISSYFTRSGRLYTGLTKDESKRLGEELGNDLGPSSEYWRDFFIRTSGKDLYLDLEDAADELKYLFLKNHKRVKNSLAERKATANFVLINKGEEDKRTSVFGRLKRRAIREFDDMNSEDIRKCLRIFGHNADRLSVEGAENRLFDIVEGDPKAFLKRWVDNDTRNTEALLERAISKNIIRKSSNLYKYGSELIGRSVFEAVAFIDEPKNQDIKISIMKQIEGKESIKENKFDTLSDLIDEAPKVSVEQKNTDAEEEEKKAKVVKDKVTNKEDTI